MNCGKVSLLILGALVVLVASPGPARAGWHPDHEIVMEVGAALPYGDLQDDFFNTPKGLGVENGYEVGFRFRYFATPRLAVSPSFHFVDFGDFSTVFVDGTQTQTFAITPATLRYGMDLQLFLTTSTEGLRPYLIGGVSLTRNRYREEERDSNGNLLSFYKAPINSLAFAAGFGLRVGVFEWSGVYHINRFDTVRILGGPDLESFAWDYLTVRAGVALPTH